MTAVPSAKLGSRPSVRLLTPNPAASSTNTKHATGMENFLCASMIGAWGDTPAARIAAACSFSSGMVSSRSPPLRSSRGEQRFGVQLYPQLPKGVDLVAARVGWVHQMALAALEHDGDAPAVSIHGDATAFRDIDIRLIRSLHVREKDIGPTLARARDLLDVQDDVREVARVEHAGLHFALGAVRLHPQKDLPKPLVGVRHHGQQQMAVERRRDGGQGQQGSQDSEQADTAGLHRHRLAIPGQPPESHQDADQQGHRYRDAE